MDVRDYLLSEGTVCLQATAADWREAVKLGTDLLEAAGAVEPRYYEAIVASVDELGPYFLLAPGLAMPHARPEQGVLRDGFALVTLAEPVCFGDVDNDPVDLLLTMAARSAEEQNKSAIVQVATLFDDETALAALRRARSLAEVKAALAAVDFDLEED
jgi:PTS system ascorbate-specific IIA component